MKEINTYLPPISGKKQPAKRYKKPDAVKQLEMIAMDRAKMKYPDMPPNYLAPRKYRDDRADLKKFVPNTQRKGMPDIQAVFRGTPLFIEVKIGGDRLSPHQKNIRDEVTGSGGVFFIARNFTEFKQWFDEIKGKAIMERELNKT